MAGRVGAGGSPEGGAGNPGQNGVQHRERLRRSACGCQAARLRAPAGGDRAGTAGLELRRRGLQHRDGGSGPVSMEGPERGGLRAQHRHSALAHRRKWPVKARSGLALRGLSSPEWRVRCFGGLGTV